MAVASTTTMANGIRDLFEPGFYEGVYRNDQVLNILRAIGVQETTAPGGLYHQWHLNSSANTSAAIFTENSPAPEAVAQGWVRAKLSYQYYWAFVAITGMARDAAQGPASIFNVIEQEMQLAQRDISDLRNTTILGSTYGLQLAVSATSTYAGIARGSAAYFESSPSTTATVAGLRSLHSAVRSPDKGGNPTAHLVSSTVMEWYVNKVGGPQALTSSSNGTMRTIVSANTGAPAFDLGHNLTGHSFMGKPIIEVPDLTSTVWLMLDTSAQNMKHVIIRPFQVKFHSNMGDSEVYEISTGSLLAVEQPKWQGIMTSIS